MARRDSTYAQSADGNFVTGLHPGYLTLRHAKGARDGAGISRGVQARPAGKGDSGRVHEMVKMGVADEDGVAVSGVLTQGIRVRSDPAGKKARGGRAREERVNQQTGAAEGEREARVSQPTHFKGHTLI